VNFLLLRLKTAPAKKAKLAACTAGGKTGTSRQLVNGKYSTQNYNASFIGFFPAENPKFIISVLVNAPKQNSIYGGDVAAPAFNEIASKIIALSPELFKHPQMKKEETAVSYAGNVNDKPEPIFATSVNSQSDRDEIDFSKKVMPNLEGKSLREAIKILSRYKVKCEITGSGKIISQGIVPGASIKKGMLCKLTAQNDTNGIMFY